MRLQGSRQTGSRVVEPLVWYFSTLRWLPLAVFGMVGAADLLAQIYNGEGVRWLFPLVCAVLGLLLFRCGCLLLQCQQPLPGKLPCRSKPAACRRR